MSNGDSDTEESILVLRRDIMIQFLAVMAETKLDVNSQMEQFLCLYQCHVKSIRCQFIPPKLHDTSKVQCLQTIKQENDVNSVSGSLQENLWTYSPCQREQQNQLTVAGDNDRFNVPLYVGTQNVVRGVSMYTETDYAAETESAHNVIRDRTPILRKGFKNSRGRTLTDTGIEQPEFEVLSNNFSCVKPERTEREDHSAGVDHYNQAPSEGGSQVSFEPEEPSISWIRRNGMLMCKLCHYTSRKTYHMRRHSYTHNIRDKPKCDLCGAFFYEPYQLREHINVKHLNSKYVCDECGKEFLSKGGLNHHRRTQHYSNTKGNRYLYTKPRLKHHW